MYDHIPEGVKAGLDVVSIGVVAGTLAGYLPSIAATFTIVWVGIQLGEWIKKKINGSNS